MKEKPIDKRSEFEAVRHHPIGGWRYILIELGIVTAGLFIALMLNGVVEWAHHKQLVRDARHNIQREVAVNRQKVRKNIAYLRASLAGVNGNIATLQQMRAGKFKRGSLANQMDFDNLDDAAWQTAKNTEALSYMPYDEAQRYSGLYSMVTLVNNRAQTVADTDFNAMAPAEMGYDIGRMPSDELTAMLRANAQAKIGVITLMQMLGEVDQELSKDSHPDGAR